MYKYIFEIEVSDGLNQRVIKIFNDHLTDEELSLTMDSILSENLLAHSVMLSSARKI